MTTEESLRTEILEWLKANHPEVMESILPYKVFDEGVSFQERRQEYYQHPILNKNFGKYDNFKRRFYRHKFCPDDILIAYDYKRKMDIDTPTPRGLCCQLTGKPNRKYYAPWEEDDEYLWVYPHDMKEFQQMYDFYSQGIWSTAEWFWGKDET